MPGDLDTFPAPLRGYAPSFCTTHWSAVLNAARPTPELGADAFARLYLDYWIPLYAYVRRRGYSPAEAEDITQDFFVCLIEKQRLAGLEREGGRFRSFLLKSLDHFLANAWRRERTQKRGNGVLSLSLDVAENKSQHDLERADQETPESLFERQWVFALLENVLKHLRAECEAAGKGHFFQDVQSHLQGDRHGPPYAEVATRHGMSEGSVKVAVHRLRHRYGLLLREEIRRTVASAEEVDNELRHLITISAR